MRHRSLPQTPLQRFPSRVAEGLRAFAFWASVCLPIGYAPIVLLPSVDPVLVAPLAAAHASSLVAGHAYASDRRGRPTAGGG